jgi:hypothetical protein
MEFFIVLAIVIAGYYVIKMVLEHRENMLRLSQGRDTETEDDNE